MQNYELTLESPVSTSFRCQKAANSLDIDARNKSIHHFSVDADITTEFNVGLIVGASGSGKTTLARKIYGADCFKTLLRPDVPVIEQFDATLSYDDCVAHLTGVGLTSVPCWIRPVYTLSNGQKARAEIALLLADASATFAVIDEWTSVVDRTVAKIMSHCVQKHARRTNRRIVLLSCHYDVVDWLNPDWIIDCNKQSFIDRRLLWRGCERPEKLQFDVRTVGRDSWRYFSKYHYLSQSIPGGHCEFFGLFHRNEQVGFICFSNYVPHRKNTAEIMHMNRIVIHPDYAGFGLGIRFIDETSELMAKRGFEVMTKYSSIPVFRAMKKNPRWVQTNEIRQHRIAIGGNMNRTGGHRLDVKCFCFRYIGANPLQNSDILPK